MFSGISIGLIFWAFQTENKTLKKILCCTELVYWTAKLIIFKGGYVVGYGGTPDIAIVFYDFISVLARLFVFSKLINVQSFRLLKISIIALLILGIKIEVFSTSIYMVYEENQSIEKTKEIRSEIIGKWEGDYQKLEYEKLLLSGKATVKIDSNFIFLNNIEGLENEYKLILEYLGHGRIYKKGFQGFEISILDYENNSMTLKLNNFGNSYHFKLRKEPSISRN